MNDDSTDNTINTDGEVGEVGDAGEVGEVVRNDRPIGDDDAFGGPCYHGIVQPLR